MRRCGCLHVYIYDIVVENLAVVLFVSGEKNCISSGVFSVVVFHSLFSM